MKLVMRAAKGTPYFVLFETKRGKICYTEDVSVVWLMSLAIISYVFWQGMVILGSCLSVFLVVWVLAFAVRAPWQGEKLALLQAKSTRNAHE